MTIHVSSSDYRARLRYWHNRVQAGEDIVVTDSGTPTVRVTSATVDSRASAGGRGLHHVELWLPELPEVERSLGWLLRQLGWSDYQRWHGGVSWRRGSTYLVVENSVDLEPGSYRRTAPGLNHIALHALDRQAVDALVNEAPVHGWFLLFADRHPFAGGPDHYAAYLESDFGLEIEVVAAGR